MQEIKTINKTDVSFLGKNEKITMNLLSSPSTLHPICVIAKLEKQGKSVTIFTGGYFIDLSLAIIHPIKDLTCNFFFFSEQYVSKSPPGMEYISFRNLTSFRNSPFQILYYNELGLSKCHFHQE